MNVKLAEALLRRKELQNKVDVLKSFRDRDFFEVKVKRQKVSEDYDDIVAQVPIMRASEVTKEYDFYARQLRLVDAAIQQANWTTDIEIGDSVMAEFE